MSEMIKDKYEAVIGLEIHAELNTKTKMFCRCLNDPFHSQPNTNVCPVCLGLPGALPVMNEMAVESTMKVGLALNCQIAEYTKWDRKNYFYPDLPKGYQISQYDLPLCSGGGLEISIDPSNHQTIQLTRIHLEEDTGTLQHPTGAAHSLVNYNRSGAPLLELVTEPDIRSGKEARLFAEEYQRILRALGVANADMEKGEMRVEANISVRTKEQAVAGTYGTKVEVKNLNSFRAAEKAIAFEINRQIEALESGETIVQETRGWNDNKQTTFSQRVKEGAADYRYFPEPDLPPLTVSQEKMKILLNNLPILPAALRLRYTEMGLSTDDADTLVNNKELATYFEAVLMPELSPKTVANMVINEAADLSVQADDLQELLVLLSKGEISSKIAKDVLTEMKSTKKKAAAIIDEKGLKQVSDGGLIEQLIDSVMEANPKEVEAYRGGKEQLFGFFVGQVMREAKGQANPQVLNETLRHKLGA
jgi:aspartyl-tRNA(Asn)/glutamyl-tRNA(Gln) amidotransferase subunit B